LVLFRPVGDQFTQVGRRASKAHRAALACGSAMLSFSMCRRACK
jgi:hypothetical protein